MFDLEQTIADWRRQMLAAGIQSPDPLEELEGHLRDEFERRMNLGQSDAEAFTNAVEKIGPAPAVQTEFAKVEVAVKVRKWQAGQIGLGAILGLLQLIVIGSVLFNSEMTFGQRLSGLAAIATSFLLLAVARLSHRVIPAIRTARTRTTVALILGGVPAIIWSAIFAAFILPNHEFPFGQWLATVLWASCPPLGAFFGFIWGIEIAARKNLVPMDVSRSRN